MSGAVQCVDGGSVFRTGGASFGVECGICPGVCDAFVGICVLVVGWRGSVMVERVQDKTNFGV